MQEYLTGNVLFAQGLFSSYSIFIRYFFFSSRSFSLSIRWANKLCALRPPNHGSAVLFQWNIIRIILLIFFIHSFVSFYLLSPDFDFDSPRFHLILVRVYVSWSSTNPRILFVSLLAFVTLHKPNFFFYWSFFLLLLCDEKGKNLEKLLSVTRIYSNTHIIYIVNLLRTFNSCAAEWLNETTF